MSLLSIISLVHIPLLLSYSTLWMHSERLVKAPKFNYRQ